VAIQEQYAREYGQKALAIPGDKGLDRALWAVPLGAFVLAAGGLAWLGMHWVRRNNRALSAAASAGPEVPDAELDKELDAELKKLDDQ
jgi:hypothetical protein